MLTWTPSPFWLDRFCRLVLALYFGAAGFAVLLSKSASGDAGEPWLPLGSSARSGVYAAVALALAVLLIAGVRVSMAAIAAAAFLYAIALDQLSTNPLYNTMNHLLPMLALALTLVWRNDTAQLRWRREQVVELFCRLFLGTIFLLQGLRAFTGAGVVEFARRVYVAPLAESWVPETLLWMAGVTNPFVQVITGTFLLVGLWTRGASFVVLAFLVTIFFGHLLADPFDSGPGVHAHAGANFALAAVVFALSERSQTLSEPRNPRAA
jgi:uncharacterized membrane protein YphA (DoxX/SURF4 family)